MQRKLYHNQISLDYYKSNDSKPSSTVPSNKYLQTKCTKVQLKILHEHLVIQTPNIAASACFMALVKFYVISNIELTNVLHIRVRNTLKVWNSYSDHMSNFDGPVTYTDKLNRHGNRFGKTYQDFCRFNKILWVYFSYFL